MKMLRAIHFDLSDKQVFEVAAKSDEWLVSGAFEFSLQEKDSIQGKVKQAFANGFLGVETRGRSTFAAVSNIEETEFECIEETLAKCFVYDFGAPNLATAKLAARDELVFAMDLCAEALINTVFTVRRYFDDLGEIREEYRKIQPPTDQPLHSKIWKITDDES